jgi:hypothetical protein
LALQPRCRGSRAGVVAGGRLADPEKRAAAMLGFTARRRLSGTHDGCPMV